MNTPDNTTPNTSSGNSGSRSLRTRRNAVIGATTGLIGGGLVGLMLTVPSLTSAASDDEPSSTVPVTSVVDSDTTSADTTGTPPVDDQAEPGARLREVLQPLVDDGTISDEQADAVTAHLIANRPERGDHGRGGPGGFGRRGFDGEVLAGVLGIDTETLRVELRAGKTVAEIAAEQGVEVQTVIDALVAEADTRLDQAVQNGRLTEEEAADKLIEITERITDRVNNGRPDRG
jgi:polyhydroxyalkanoate synthesis regulator phasin